MSKTLTKAQRRILERAVEKPGVTFNGIASRPIRALREAGLVSACLAVRASGLGRHVDLWAVTPTAAGVALVQGDAR